MSSLKKNLDAALEGQELPPEAYLPPVIMGKKVATTWDGLEKLRVPTIEEQRIRIQAECDPVGQLMAIANGLPVASFHIEMDKDGNPVSKIKYETANLATRIKLLEAMRDKIVPNISMNTKPKNPKEDDEDGWDQLTRKRSAGVLEEESD